MVWWQETKSYSASVKRDLFDGVRALSRKLAVEVEADVMGAEGSSAALASALSSLGHVCFTPFLVD